MSVVKLSGDSTCPVTPHLNSGCGFPAPNAEIFFLEPYTTLNVFGMEFVIGKTSILAALVSLIVATFFLAAARPRKMVPAVNRRAGLLVCPRSNCSGSYWQRRRSFRTVPRFAFLLRLDFKLDGCNPRCAIPNHVQFGISGFADTYGLRDLHVHRYEASRTD